MSYDLKICFLKHLKIFLQNLGKYNLLSRFKKKPTDNETRGRIREIFGSSRKKEIIKMN